MLHIVVFSFSFTAAWAYSYPGYKWSGTSANYYINNVFAASFQTAMQMADAAWDNAGSKFRFYYMGTTSRNPNTYAANYSQDGYNDIGYYNYGNTGQVARIAKTRTGGVGITILEDDTTLNIYYGFTTVGAAGMYDVQNTVTHEFGHWLLLGDLTSQLSPSFCGTAAESTMCDSATTNETRKRSLETDDKNGIKAIYGI